MVASANPQVAQFEREIYRLVVIEQVPLPLVAERMQVPDAEIRELIARVTAAMVAAAPAETKEQRQRRIDLSERIAAEQLRMVIGEAMNAFRESQGEQTIVRKVGDGEPVTIRRFSHGDTRMLQTAARIAVMLAKLPAGSLWEQPCAPTVNAESQSEASQRTEPGKSS